MVSIMRAALAVLLLSAALAAQTPDQASLVGLTLELHTAIQNGSFNSAVEIATRLDAAVQSQLRASLVRDSRERVDEVLSWLPTDTESVWVNQEPFTINTEESERVLFGRPAQFYALDRLMVLNDGGFYSALANNTVRLVVAATRGIPGPQYGGYSIPGVMSPQDVVYLYFFSQPVELPPPDESDQGRPVWQASAKLDSGVPAHEGEERAQREDRNWLALARPDLLVLASQKELLNEMLLRIARGSKTRALPAALPEWAQTDRTAPFWGLRHYTARSKPKPGERGCAAAELPIPDCNATGVTVRFDTAQQRLEIRYLSDTQPAQRRPGDGGDRNFQVDQPQTGVWRRVSDVEARGPYPVHFALVMLGFGRYR
ncbi:MAG: hypothetical protein ACLQBJ_02235 [Bryobacteraceae bacterium]